METATLKIAVIGAGNMGGAIVRGLASGSLVAKSNIRVSDIGEQNLQSLKSFAPEITTSTSNTEIVEGSDIIMLAVKPWLVNQIADEIKKKINYKKQIIVSVAAGVDFKVLADLFSDDATLFRVIPNTEIGRASCRGRV